MNNKASITEIQNNISQIQYLGQQFVDFGLALQDQDSTLLELQVKASKCGLNFQFRITQDKNETIYNEPISK